MKLGMFLSNFDSKVDDKRRVSVPASFRKALGGEDVVYIWPSIDKSKACLEGGGRGLIANFQNALRRLKPMDPRRRALEYGILGQCREFSFDAGGGGRIVLTKEFAAFAGIKNEAKFVGLGDRFEIWSSEGYDKMAAEMIRIAEDSGDLIDPFDPGFAIGVEVAE